MYRLTAVVGSTQKQWAYPSKKEAQSALDRVQNYFSIKPQTGLIVRNDDGISILYYCQDLSPHHLKFEVTEA